MSESNNGAGAAPQSAALVPVPQPNDLAALLLRAGQPAICSFDTTTLQGRELLQKCEEEPDKPVRELVNVELELQHVYARIVDYTNPETGEVYPILRICLVTSDGKVHPCASDGIRDALVRFMGGKRFPPFKPPIRCRIALKALGGKKQRLTLLEVFDKPKGGRS